MRKLSRGFSVIELMIVVTVVGITLALAVPSYSDIINKRAVTDAAEQAAIFMSLARTESLKRNIPMTVTFDATATPFCAGMDDTAAACDCRDSTAADYCAITQGGVTSNLVLSGAEYQNLKAPALTSGGSSKTSLALTFDPVRGVLDNTNDNSGEILLTSANDKYALRVDTTITGRIEICTTSAKPVPGFQAC